MPLAGLNAHQYPHKDAQQVGSPEDRSPQYMDSPSTRVFVAPTRGLAEPWAAGHRAKESSSNTQTSS